MTDGCEPPRLDRIMALSEENGAVGGSGTADVFLAISGLLRLALDGLEVHVN